MIELRLVTSILKLTGKGSASVAALKVDAGVPTDAMYELLQNLQNEELVQLRGDSIETDSAARLRLAVKAVQLGADIERVSNMLSWREFEEISAHALRSNGYSTRNNVHFKHNGRRWEIDVIGCRKPLVVCIDCKHYHRGVSPSALNKIAEAQKLRTKALAEALPAPKVEWEWARWEKAKFLPAVISLLPSTAKFLDGIPVVPVLQLQDFISQIPIQIESLVYFCRNYSHLGHDSLKRCSR